jgi:hypothetical protein
LIIGFLVLIINPFDNQTESWTWEWKSGWCVWILGEGDSRFCIYSVKCLVLWIVGRIGKLGRDVVKTLIIKVKDLDNQDLS